MPELSAEQKKQIEILARTHSGAKIAKKLRLDPRQVQMQLEAIARQRRRRRERIFRLVMLTFPVFFFFGIEFILRALHYGGNLALFIPSETMPGYLQVNENVGRRYFAAADITPETSHDLFRAQKAANAYRVFVLGESTTAGYPYMYNGSMSKMLYQRLLDYFPEREIEVVNLAMPAINSFSLRDLTPEALAQKPDALIIYCGHNEFYGALGVGSTESLGRWRRMINLYLRLQRLKIMLFLRDQLEAVKKWMHSPAKRIAAHTTLMEEMVAEEQIPHHSALYQRAQEFFKANLTEIILTAQRQGVRVLLCNLVSNVRDLPPFVSLYAPHNDRVAYERALSRGAQLAAAGKFTEALALYDSLQRVDDSPALLHFQIGKCLEAMGNFAEARQAYEKARDFDVLRFRASTDFNTAVQEVAQATGAVLVDMEAAFEQVSPHGLIGNNLMLEHVHPNVEGYFLMGRELCRAMRENGFISDKWDETRAKPDSVYWQERGVTALDEEIARIRIDVLTHNWPFVPKDRVVGFRYQPQNLLQKLAYAAWKREETWEKVHVLLAEDYEQHGQLDLAAKEYEAIILQTPYNVSPYLRAGILYTKLQDYDRAFDRLTKSLALEPSADAYKIIGAILLHRRQPEKAVFYLQKASQLEPSNEQTLYNLASACLMVGQIEEAQKALAKLERLIPGSAQVEQLKKMLVRLH
ncbi:MAG: tetratricopeptide repeat protein [candidate division KSB1 bacterium]|nr:tetratricopeptide repeat protein [candidate division KSB1 bacterium]MDZ7301044.1 tetratricopeptide repeat protein [candidate division KSB1 bacterium]MDZ7312131.1 tetratricopeptide repeat protein [candidate division KSB1 bacterium]